MPKTKRKTRAKGKRQAPAAAPAPAPAPRKRPTPTPRGKRKAIPISDDVYCPICGLGPFKGSKGLVSHIASQHPARDALRRTGGTLANRIASAKQGIAKAKIAKNLLKKSFGTAELVGSQVGDAISGWSSDFSTLIPTLSQLGKLVKQTVLGSGGNIFKPVIDSRGGRINVPGVAGKLLRVCTQLNHPIDINDHKNLLFARQGGFLPLGVLTSLLPTIASALIPVAVKGLRKVTGLGLPVGGSIGQLKFESSGIRSGDVQW